MTNSDLLSIHLYLNFVHVVHREGHEAQFPWYYENSTLQKACKGKVKEFIKTNITGPKVKSDLVRRKKKSVQND